MKKILEFLRNLYAPKTNAPEFKPIVLSLVTQIRKPYTRFEKRLMLQEYKKVNEQIKPLEDKCLENVINEHSESDLYLYYLNAFIFKAKTLNQKLKFIQINELYFAQLYSKKL